MTELTYGRPMRVVPFFSGGASSAKSMYNDSNHGELYEVVGAFTDNPISEKSLRGRRLIEEIFSAPLLGLSRKDFYDREELDPQDSGSRKKYYEEVARQIEPFEADVIAMCGYMHIVTEPLLTSYTVLNVHPADLSILTDQDGKRIHLGCMPREKAEEVIQERQLRRKYIGDDAVYDAITAGEGYVLSTVHIATEEVDGGPIVVQSHAFGIDQNYVRSLDEKGLREYAGNLQIDMKTYCDGPAYLRALELLATTLDVTPDKRLILNGEELPYGGMQL